MAVFLYMYIFWWLVFSELPNSSIPVVDVTCMCIFLVACNESLCSFWTSWTSCNAQCLSFGSRVCNQGGNCAESMTVQCTGGSCSTGKLSVITVDLHNYNIRYKIFTKCDFNPLME